MVVPSSNTFCGRDYFVVLVIIAGCLPPLFMAADSSNNGYGNGDRYVNDNRALRMQQLQSYQERKQWPPQDNSRSMRPPPDKPSPYQKAFKLKEECATNCLSHCYPIYFTDDNTIYICTQVKPPELPLYDKLFKESNWPWLLFLIVICGSFVICVACACWNCCCKKLPSEDPRGGRISGGSSRGDGTDCSREPLAIDRRIDDIIPTTPLQGKTFHGTRNGNLSTSKYVADV